MTQRTGPTTAAAPAVAAAAAVSRKSHLGGPTRSSVSINREIGRVEDPVRLTYYYHYYYHHYRYHSHTTLTTHERLNENISNKSYNLDNNRYHITTVCVE